MANLSKIDRNFVIGKNIKKSDVKFYNADEAPFKIYGVFKENGLYRRMPESVAKKVSEGVYELHTNTSGGRIRFLTDSEYVAIHADMEKLCRIPHCSLTGTAGFDLYADNTYIKAFIPPYDMENGYENIVELGSRSLREITINFPSYSNVKKLYIGLQENAVIKEATEYKIQKPFVYYGSSITQGACASRPGMSYQNIISRKFNCDYINLGFSGTARAEDEMIEYIKNLDMSVFVCDYDHNAPSVEHLCDTHEKMFKEVRKMHPHIPVIFMSRPKYTLTEDEIKRMRVIENTYKNALLNGDKNVYFLGGRELMKLCENDGVVDGGHPSDFGFVSMAKAIEDILHSIQL